MEARLCSIWSIVFTYAHTSYRHPGIVENIYETSSRTGNHLSALPLPSAPVYRFGTANAEKGRGEYLPLEVATSEKELCELLFDIPSVKKNIKLCEECSRYSWICLCTWRSLSCACSWIVHHAYPTSPVHTSHLYAWHLSPKNHGRSVFIIGKNQCRLLQYHITGFNMAVEERPLVDPAQRSSNIDNTHQQVSVD